VLLLVAPITILLFRWLIPAHIGRTRGREEPIVARRVVGYAAPDYLAYLVWSATISVLPLVVLQLSGAAANAYFFVAWTIASALYLIPSSMGMAMIAEASLDPEQLAVHTRRTIIESARLVVPAVAVIVVGASLILGLMGESYAREGATLLRLLALSAIPFIVVAAYANVARVQQRMRAVVWTFGALCGIVFALGIPLLEAIGIVGLGIAWLVAQCVVAVAVIFAYLRQDPRRDLRDRILRAISGAARWARSWHRRIGSARAREGILAGLRRGQSEMSSWRVRGHLGAFNDIAVSTVGPAWTAPIALLKRACSRAADGSLTSEEQVLVALNEDSRLGAWTGLIPEVMASGTHRGRRFLVETRVSGVSSERLIEQGLDSARVVAATEAAIRPLHEATGAVTSIDHNLLRQWIDVPIARLRPVVGGHSRLEGAEQALERLARDLRRTLEGRRVTMSFVHGDLSPGNILMSHDGAAVTGLVDWEAGQERGLPQVDLIHLWMTTAMVAQQRELGAVVAELLGDWQSPDNGEAGGGEAESSGAFTRAVVLLAWLHHAAANVTKSKRYRRSGIWVHRNIDPVLGSFLPSYATTPAPAGQKELPLPAPRWPGTGLGERMRVGREAIKAAPLALVAPVAGLSAAIVLWLLSLGSIDPRGMTDLGLLAVLPPIFFLALALLTASFVTLVHRHPERRALLSAHLVALIAFLHATPAIAYGTLRYSWAWKHVGVIDYIQRHGDVAPTIHALDVYHNWPGFFALNALLNELAGLGDSIDLASWGPLFFNLLDLGALLFVFSALTRDRRIIWIGAWLFFIANWVGQDYFSPQAFAFFLYLVTLGVVLRWLRTRPVETTSRAFRWPSLRGWTFRTPLTEEGAVPRAVDRGTRWAAIALVILAITAIAASHALTSVMMTLALAALVLSGVCAVRSLPLVAAGIAVLWMSTFASSFVSKHAGSTLDSVRFPWATTESSLGPAGQFSDGQALVAHISRGLVVAMIALAVLGAIRQLRGGGLDRPPVILALAPALLFASGDYDGELLFRIYLFAVPFLAFLAAHAYLPPASESSRSWRPVAIYAVSGAVILGAFLFSYYGKDRQYYFTPAEVAASQYLYTHAPPDSLLIQASVNYPSQFKNYERFDYVMLASEPPDSQARVLARPAAVLSEWMSEPGYRDAFLIITRSQIAELEDLGEMPSGSLQRIERALLASPKFDVVLRNRDAIIFTPAPRSGGTSA
jgi:aminoglycoside phosphotransferase